VSAIESTRLWIIDQPFSAEAAMFGSFAACESGEWDMCREFVEAGRRSNPDNLILLNNVAFAEIGAGNMRDAAAALERARKLVGSDSQRLTLAATEALFLFRIGMIELGRQRYDAVIRAFAKVHEREYQAKAALMLAREELAAETQQFDKAWKRADQLARDSNHAHVRQLHDKLAEMVRGDAPSPKALRPEPGALEELAQPILPEPAVLSAD
jgi:tetratricopeptide (TPR) repeat protein